MAEAAEGLLKESMEKPSFKPGSARACRTETELAEENEGPLKKGECTKTE